MTTTTEQAFRDHLATAEASMPAWLPDAQLEAIERTIPVCPRCGDVIKYVHMVAHQLHSFATEIDGACGDILASSQHEDTTIVEPEQDWQTVAGERVSVGVIVECPSGHEWTEKRLQRDEKGSSTTYDRWDVLPMTEMPTCIFCGVAGHWSTDCKS